MLSLQCALNLKHQASDLSSNLIVCIQFNNTCTDTYIHTHLINYTKTYFFLQLVSVAELVKQNKLCPAQVEVPRQRRVLEAPGTQVEGKLITVLLLHQLHTKLQDFWILGLDVCQPCHGHTKSQSTTKSCISSTQSFKSSESWAWMHANLVNIIQINLVNIIQNQSVTNCRINSIQSFRISWQWSNTNRHWPSPSSLSSSLPITMVRTGSVHGLSIRACSTPKRVKPRGAICWWHVSNDDWKFWRHFSSSSNCCHLMSKTTRAHCLKWIQ